MTFYLDKIKRIICLNNIDLNINRSSRKKREQVNVEYIHLYNKRFLFLSLLLLLFKLFLSLVVYVIEQISRVVPPPPSLLFFIEHYVIRCICMKLFYFLHTSAVKNNNLITQK